jgi:hypothetical protein
MCPALNEVLIVSPFYKDYVSQVKALYDADGHPATIVDALPENLTPYGLILINNPYSTWLPAQDVARLKEFIQRERRLIIVGDHCKFGCFVSAPYITQILADLGVHASYSGTEGLPGGTTGILAHRLTADVSALSFVYTGALLDVAPPAEVLAVVSSDQDVLAIVERPAYVTSSLFGDVVVISDMDVMTATTPSTTAFFRNLFSVP